MDGPQWIKISIRWISLQVDPTMAWTPHRSSGRDWDKWCGTGRNSRPLEVLESPTIPTTTSAEISRVRSTQWERTAERWLMLTPTITIQILILWLINNSSCQATWWAHRLTWIHRWDSTLACLKVSKSCIDVEELTDGGNRL